MNIFDIVDLTRSEILDDHLIPYRWENRALLTHLNRSYEELCRETFCLIDSTTVATCRVNLLSNQSTYSLHAKVLKVLGARRQSDDFPLIAKSESYMDSLLTGWRTTTGQPFIRVMNTADRIFSIYPKYDSVGYIAGSSDITFVAATSKITKAGATFTSHYSTGDSLVVTGSTSNNGTFTITNVTATEITVSETLVNESNTSAVLQKVREVAILRVARLPLTMWTLGDLEGSNPPSPEIDETYHTGLFDGIAKFAFLKQDTEVYDPTKAASHKADFEDFKSRVRWEIADLTEGGTIAEPHYGAL